MRELDPDYYHKIYGTKRTRLAFAKKDFLDYSIMSLICAAILIFTFGLTHPVTYVGLFCCVFMVITFVIRHGVEFKVPLIIRRPQDVLFMFYYKIENLHWSYYLAVVVLVLENIIIKLTPDWPHNTELMHDIAIWALFLHLIGLSLFRTVILIDHLRKKDKVLEILMQTTWKKFLSKQPSIVLEIFHAYFTGIMCHILLVAPWYLVLSYADYSILLLPVVCILNAVLQFRYLKAHNSCFYRDHWLGHNSELEFIYLHGAHHDALPSGLIAVAGNGHLEGFFRYLIGFPTSFFNPITAFIFNTSVVVQDIIAHQYIPGIFPTVTRQFHKIAQHSIHHFGALAPYSFGLKFDQPDISEQAKKGSWGFPVELKNSIELDEKLNGFKWDNPAYRRYLDLFEKYQGDGK